MFVRVCERERVRERERERESERESDCEICLWGWVKKKRIKL